MIILNTAPIYGSNDKGELEISITPASIRTSGFINFTGFCYSDQKYKIVRSMVSSQGAFKGFPIVTHNDLVAQDAFIEDLNRSTPIIMIVGDKAEIVGASKKRLERAQEKLHAEGFNCVHLVSTIKQAERLIQQALKGTIKRRAENVINVNFGRAV